MGEFDPSVDDWNSYAERLDHYLAANDVANAKKKWSILLSSCGASTYKLIRNLTSPQPPTSKTYKEIVELVQTHYSPKPSMIVQRLKFNSCSRQQGESVSVFIARLRQLTEYCDFDHSLEAMLHDRFVCGINDTRVQRRLLQDHDLT